jgi:RNAse (barnase) inhibitor barstar
MKKVYQIDGNKFSTLEEFYEEISSILIPGTYWGKNLDAFNDLLRGGFGTPEEGFILVWENSEISKKKLSYAETVRQLQYKLQKCHSTAKAKINIELQEAKNKTGPTVFDWLVEIIKYHCKDGDEAASGVELILN